MAGAAVEKTEEVLRKEIDELQRQQREVFFSLFFLSFLYNSLSLPPSQFNCHMLLLLTIFRLRNGFETLGDSAREARRLLCPAILPPMVLSRVALLDL